MRKGHDKKRKRISIKQHIRPEKRNTLHQRGIEAGAIKLPELELVLTLVFMSTIVKYNCDTLSLKFLLFQFCFPVCTASFMSGM